MRFLGLIAALALLTSCSSVLEGTSQEIMVNTTPEKAKCEFVRENVTIATISETPASTTVKKDKHDITIKCNKPGYQEATYINKSDVAGATVGNVLAGGVIGWAVDSASGADNKYETPVNMTLVPGKSHKAKKAKAAK